MPVKRLNDRIDGLIRSPKQEWEKVDKEYFAGVWILLRQYFIPILLIVSTAMLLKFFITTDFDKSLSRELLKNVFIPLAFLIAYLILLFFIGIVMEEAAHTVGARENEMGGHKLLFFSALPFLISIALWPIPYLGKIVVMVFFVYQFYLFYMGAEQIFRLSPKRKWLWLLTGLLTFALIFGVFALIYLGIVIVKNYLI